MTRIQGKIISGLGRGSYFIEKYKSKLEKELGWTPFLGTLNVQLEEDFKITKENTLLIQKFTQNRKIFNEILIKPCKIEDLKSAITIPVKTSHKNTIIEIISASNLRKKLNLKDGSVIKIEI